MALVPQQASRDVATFRTVPVGAAIGQNGYGNTIQMISEPRQTDVEQHRRVFNFLRRELQSSWHPSFKYTTVLIQNIADCLHAISPQEVAGLRISCKADGALPGG